jgi:aldose 1-epimerase
VPEPPSGEQFEISYGDQHAVIVEVGGGIRTYSAAGRDVLDGYADHEMCDGAHGAPLIPWPNRLADGKYRFDGIDYQVAITEPAKSNAIHGFLRWRSWRALERDSAEVVVGTVLRPLQGYPFSLDVRISYRLGIDGLTVTTTATNIGAAAAPWACGAHPYLSPGAGSLDECELEFTAGLRVETDERQLPAGDVAAAGTVYDFSAKRRIGALAMDYAFRNLVRDDEGRAWVRLTGSDGRCAQLWLDKSYAVVEMFTGDTLRSPRRGLGVEPMTAPPNAFASGDGVMRLEPGATTRHQWGVQLI